MKKNHHHNIMMMANTMAPPTNTRKLVPLDQSKASRTSILILTFPILLSSVSCCYLFNCLFTVDAQLISSSNYPHQYQQHQHQQQHQQQQQQQQYYQQQQQQQLQNRFHPYQQDSQQINSMQSHHSTSNRLFSCGKLYYSTFYLDQQRDVLYIGAMDALYKVDLANINRTDCERDVLKLEPKDPLKCVNKGKSENYDCRNHIKVIQPMSKSGDKLYIGGTNAYSPRDYVVTSNLQESPEMWPGVGNGHAKCPYGPDDNSTAVWVDSGNPSNISGIYTGTTAEYSKADAIIYRQDLYWANGTKAYEAKRTAKYDSKWLDKPNFVGSFDIGDHVYFFFRESAIEYINCGKSIYSRVARVCKRDNGSKPHLSAKEWTSFMKARLNCSIAGDFPFYFDEIQSIYRNPNDERKFHAIFTTSNNGLTGSAICTFTLDAIQQSFNGNFKGQVDSSHAWLTVHNFNFNKAEPRPGSCVDNSLTLSDSYVTFMRTHPLMDSAVGHENGKPVFYRRDVMFTKIVVDTVEIDGFNYTVYFAGTNTGHIYKIVEWSTPQMMNNMQQQQQQQQQDNGAGGDSQSSSSTNQQRQTQSQSNLVEIIEATTPEPVKAIEISTRHKSLYVASESQVKQISLLNCKQRHDNCLQCIRDPYCGWDKDKQECRHLSTSGSSNVIQDVTNDTPYICHNNIKHKEMRVTWGQSVHLPCPISLPLISGDMQSKEREQQQINSFAIMRQQQLMQQQFDNNNNNNNNNNYYGQQHIDASNGVTNYISWYYHSRESTSSQGSPILQQRDKFILAADQGLVIMSANQAGWYQCRLGSQTIYSYNVIVDTKTCSTPNENEFRQIYADWCREMNRYKQSYRQYQLNLNRCQQNSMLNQPMIGASDSYSGGLSQDS